MGSAMFYHLTRSPVETLVPQLIARAQSAGWRIELRGTAPDRMSRLDEVLWQGDGFLPHGLAGGPHDAMQPILLTVAGQDAPNAATCLMAVDGADVSVAEVTSNDRTLILFDGNDAAALERARGQWRELAAGNVTAEYWSEADGRWERKR